jgi:hypothetical protein
MSIITNGRARFGGNPIVLAMAIECAYVPAIDIWPDDVAVSPSLIARRAFRPPPKHRRIAAGRALGATLSRTATDYSKRTTPYD